MKKTPLLLTILLLVVLVRPVWGQDSSDPVRDDYPYLAKLYQYLHSNPELYGQETGTAQRVAEELRTAGFAVTEKVGTYGIVGVYRNGQGPTVMVRADFDALPITEETGLPYASKVKGKIMVGPNLQDTGIFHGCGHDMHTTIMIGTARFLLRNKDKWRGTLVMVGQPAEEDTTGARSMIKDGLFSRFPRPDFIIGLHVMPFPAGYVGYHEGYWFAGDTTMDVTIRGVGGNSHRPQDCKDPVVIAAQTILALQTIVSREIDPADPAVLGVSPIRGGMSPWTIPDEVFMSVDIRAFKEEVRQKIMSSVRRITSNIARAAGVPEDRLPIVKETMYSPPLYNDIALTRRVKRVLETTFGQQATLDLPQVMGTEDFASFGLEKPAIPICFFGIGSVNPQVFQDAVKAGQTVPGLHNPRFAPELEPTLKTGVKAMLAVVLDLFPGK